jgi:hypothetical protein
MSVNDRMNLVFQDADIIPLFVQARVLPPMLAPCCLLTGESTGELREHAPGRCQQ